MKLISTSRAGSAYQLCLDGDYAYMSSSSGLYIVDVSNQNDPGLKTNERLILWKLS